MLQNIKIGVRPRKRGLTPLSNRGFTLLEAVIATSIVTIGIIGILIVSQNSVLIVYQARDRLTAAYLAKEGMEIVRNIRDDNWLHVPPTRAWNTGLAAGNYIASFEDRSLRPYVTTPLLINADGFYNYTVGTPTKFTRRIIITSIDVSSIRIRVEVRWGARPGFEGYTFLVEEILYNWR